MTDQIKNDILQIIKLRGFEDVLTSVTVVSKGLDANQNPQFKCTIKCAKPFSISTSTSNFVWINSHYMNGESLDIEFKTGFAAPLNDWRSEISSLLYFYVTPHY